MSSPEAHDFVITEACSYSYLRHALFQPFQGGSPGTYLDFEPILKLLFTRRMPRSQAYRLFNPKYLRRAPNPALKIDKVPRLLQFLLSIEAFGELRKANSNFQSLIKQVNTYFGTYFLRF